MQAWFEIGSELFVNLAAVWFALVFIEPQLNELPPELVLATLTLRFASGIVSLGIAKALREEAKKL